MVTPVEVTEIEYPQTHIEIYRNPGLVLIVTVHSNYDYFIQNNRGEKTCQRHYYNPVADYYIDVNALPKQDGD